MRKRHCDAEHNGFIITNNKALRLQITLQRGTRKSSSICVCVCVCVGECVSYLFEFVRSKLVQYALSTHWLGKRLKGADHLGGTSKGPKRGPQRDHSGAHRANNAASGVLNGFVCMSNYRKHNFKPGCLLWLPKTGRKPNTNWTKQIGRKKKEKKM